MRQSLPQASQSPGQLFADDCCKTASGINREFFIH